jgi:hypothetical protein
VHPTGWLILLFVCTRPLAAAQPPGQDSRALPVADPALAVTVVARVGPATISAREFLLSYEFGPAFVKRQKDSRGRHLDFMVNEQLLALDAADRGERSAPEVKRSVSEIEDDLVTEELYRDDVLSRVRLSEEEIQDATAAQRIHHSIRWLYAPTREGIEDYRDFLAHGAGFDSVFALQLGDTVTADLRSWDATRFNMKTLRPSIARVVDTLKFQVASAPIEGPDGWYIIFLRSTDIDLITTGPEEIKQRENARRALTQQKADSLSDSYINGLMLSHSPEIERRTFDMLGAYLAQFWLPDDMRGTMLNELSVDRETIMSAIADIGKFDTEPLVKIKRRSVSLGRFLAWYRAREHVVRLRATSVRAYHASLQQMVWQMVRDGLLIERAKQRGLEKRESVLTQMAWWEDKALYSLGKKRLADSITLDAAALVRYYDQHRSNYRGADGDTLSFAQAKDQVRSDCFTAEFTRRLLHRLVALKRKYAVVIFEDVLRSLPVADEDNPKAIDMYFAKKGGTFPHPAFPTIDQEWQGWQ